MTTRIRPPTVVAARHHRNHRRVETTTATGDGRPQHSLSAAAGTADLPADAQLTEPVQQGLLDHPADLAQAATMLGATAGDDGHNVVVADQLAVAGGCSRRARPCDVRTPGRHLTDMPTGVPSRCPGWR
jgi:hypothetical protein